MKYLEIAVSTNEFASEIVAEFLSELTGEGVAIYSKNDFMNADWDYCDQKILDALTDDVLVKGFAKAEESDEVLKNLSERLENLKKQGDFGNLTISVKDIDADEWLTYRKKFFKPLKIKRIVICPHDEPYTATGTEVVVKLDIGIAFGTGEHETTSSCLNLGQTIDVKGKEIADLGCGSGILGISFLKLGAEKCFFVDYDVQAYEATKRNLELNGLTDKGIVECGTFDKFDGKYDVIFANMTADVILTFIKDIKRFAKPGAQMVFSGILLEKECDILLMCNEENIEVQKIIRRGEWTTMVVKLNG